MGLKILVDLFDVLCTLVVYISYNMGNRDLPDIYARAIGPATLGLGHIPYKWFYWRVKYLAIYSKNSVGVILIWRHKLFLPITRV